MVHLWTHLHVQEPQNIISSPGSQSQETVTVDPTTHDAVLMATNPKFCCLTVSCVAKRGVSRATVSVRNHPAVHQACACSKTNECQQPHPVAPGIMTSTSAPPWQPSGPRPVISTIHACLQSTLLQNPHTPLLGPSLVVSPLGPFPGSSLVHYCGLRWANRPRTEPHWVP